MNRVREAVDAAWHSKQVWLLQVLLNPVLLVAAALWLNIPEAHVWQLLLSAIMVLIVALAWVWLQAGSLAYFALTEKERNLREAFAGTLRSLVPFLAWIALMVFCLDFVAGWHENTRPMASYIRSGFSRVMRNHFSQAQADWLLTSLAWFVFWILVPGVFLPLAREIARRGVRGFDKVGWMWWFRTVRSGWYWIGVALLSVLGVYLPQRLIAWLPLMSSYASEMTSLILRFTAAWLLASAAWTLLLSLLGAYSRRAPEVSGQPPA